MDWAYKAALTAAVVAAVMMAARLVGRGASGLLAGLPLISAPALVWLTDERGAAFAAASATGALGACVVAPLFACVFAWAARHRGAGPALALSLAALGLSLPVLSLLEGRPFASLATAVGACLLVGRAMARRPVAASWVRPLPGEPWLSAVLAGCVSAGVSLAAQSLGAFWAGLLSALPLISACAMVHLRRAGGPGEVARFVAGYVPGVLAKALFLFAFATVLPPLGLPVALVLATATGAAGALLLAQPWRRAAPTRPLRAGARLSPGRGIDFFRPRS